MGSSSSADTSYAYPLSAPTIHPLLMGLLRGSDPETLLPLAPGIRDWETIITDAAKHRLTPLVYKWLNRSDLAGRLPASAASRLERQHVDLAARNMLLSSELGNILRAFEERQLACAPLRGPALAERLYGDVTARPMGDLDLLVHKKELADAATILRALGYREMDRRPGFARAYSYTLKFLKDRHGWLIVEPHWSIAYPPFVDRLDMSQVWERCVRGQVDGVETWLLDREDLLLHLCLHLTHSDRTAPLLWFYEVDRLFRQDQEAFDWSRLLSLAEQAGVGFLVSQALTEVKTLFAAPIPGHVLAQLSREPARSVEGRLLRLLAGASSVDGKEGFAVLVTLKGFCSKLHYALALLVPSPEFMRLQYGLTHRSQLALAYIRRLCRFSWEGLKGVVKLLSCG